MRKDILKNNIYKNFDYLGNLSSDYIYDDDNFERVFYKTEDDFFNYKPIQVNKDISSIYDENNYNYMDEEILYLLSENPPTPYLNKNVKVNSEGQYTHRITDEYVNELLSDIYRDSFLWYSFRKGYNKHSLEYRHEYIQLLGLEGIQLLKYLINFENNLYNMGVGYRGLWFELNQKDLLIFGNLVYDSVKKQKHLVENNYINLYEDGVTKKLYASINHIVLYSDLFFPVMLEDFYNVYKSSFRDNIIEKSVTVYMAFILQLVYNGFLENAFLEETLKNDLLKIGYDNIISVWEEKGVQF